MSTVSNATSLVISASYLENSMTGSQFAATTGSLALSSHGLYGELQQLEHSSPLFNNHISLTSCVQCFSPGWTAGGLACGDSTSWRVLLEHLACVLRCRYVSVCRIHVFADQSPMVMQVMRLLLTVSMMVNRLWQITCEEAG